MGQKLFSKCYSEFLIDSIRLEFGKLFSGIQMNMVLKNSCSPRFYKLDFLKRCKEFIWKHLRSITVIKKRLQSRCFPVNFAKFLKTPFFKEHLRATASGFFHSPNCFLPPSEPIEVRFSYIWTCFITAFKCDKYKFGFGKLYFPKQMTQLLLH